MAKPGLAIPTKIKDSTRFYPYFKDCVGAIDGTHILAMIPGQDTASYRNRKGQISQNVLAACNFDLEFTYVLSGWEGSAHDAKVLQDALTRNTNKLVVPEEDDVEETNVDQINDEEEEQLHCTQEQQRVLANTWRANIAASMWTDAMNMGS
ncbi:PREDICTED: putative nuclease HARBI1 [Camelina sativa]|uniref:Nuclease HARBI1 n=1 Tax=Camelina sativa TaxID=90675 RepID=A0ABM1RC00_CAMSA|nr:PREDICTED: putative nuclease HARBI1 [Camelina sativa]XP_019096538.1 PREDICTED: putative nuclease HARBI1 [Camelina sativa]